MAASVDFAHELEQQQEASRRSRSARRQWHPLVAPALWALGVAVIGAAALILGTLNPTPEQLSIFY